MRTIRLNEKGVVYHLISRLVDRNWFIESEQERRLYLQLFGRAIRASDWRCIAFAVMSNHIHLGVVAGEEPLGPWIRRVHSPFADALNRGRNRIGSVFVRGPKDRAIPPEKVATLIAYIHNNPVRAAVVNRAEESSWTSHRAYLGLDTRPAWLDVAIGFSSFGFDRHALEAATAAEIRERRHINLEELRERARVRGGVEVATPLFAETVEAPLVARPYAHIRPAPSVVIAAVGNAVGMPTFSICSRQNCSRSNQARRIVAHSAYLLGLTGSEIAAALGVSHQAVSKMRARSLAAFEAALVDRVVRTICNEPQTTPLEIAFNP